MASEEQSLNYEVEVIYTSKYGRTETYRGNFLTIGYSRAEERAREFVQTYLRPSEILEVRITLSA